MTSENVPTSDHDALVDPWLVPPEHRPHCPLNGQPCTSWTCLVDVCVDAKKDNRVRPTHHGFADLSGSPHCEIGLRRSGEPCICTHEIVTYESRDGGQRCACCFGLVATHNPSDRGAE